MIQQNICDLDARARQWKETRGTVLASMDRAGRHHRTCPGPLRSTARRSGPST
jgi:hypothetical protein